MTEITTEQANRQLSLIIGGVTTVIMIYIMCGVMGLGFIGFIIAIIAGVMCIGMVGGMATKKSAMENLANSKEEKKGE